ncbi:J domain-containing protein [Streptomyces sp. NRRL S-337]|uniref:J domain-containing protein n=1 Tax=Streptomyces sp. NRRL S-337 TaxID=1463900 RepID=UPI00099C337A|nr:J domain-containing protein [Streptomyces sp. NRRL S-337]
MEKRDPWAVLGIQSGATMEEIKKAYREKVRLLHPDIHESRPETRGETEEEMKEVNEAYYLLTRRTAGESVNECDARRGSTAQEQAAREKVAREQAIREKAAREKVAREQAIREKAGRPREGRPGEARDCAGSFESLACRCCNICCCDFC